MAVCVYQSNATTWRQSYEATPNPGCVSGSTGLVVSLSEWDEYQALKNGVIQTATGPFDYVAAGAIFSFFFAFTVGCWVVARNAGLILEAVKRW